MSKLKSFRPRDSTIHTKTNESPLSSSTNDAGAIVAMPPMNLFASHDMISSDGDMESPRFKSNDSLLDSRQKQKSSMFKDDNHLNKSKKIMLGVNNKLKSQSMRLNAQRNKFKKTKDKQEKLTRSVTFAVSEVAPTTPTPTPDISVDHDTNINTLNNSGNSTSNIVNYRGVGHTQGDGILTPTPTSPHRSDTAITENQNENQNHNINNGAGNAVSAVGAGSNNHNLQQQQSRVLNNEHQMAGITQVNGMNGLNRASTNLNEMSGIHAVRISPQNSLSVATGTQVTPLATSSNARGLEDVPKMKEKLDRQISTYSDTVGSRKVKLSVT